MWPSARMKRLRSSSSPVAVAVGGMAGEGQIREVLTCYGRVGVVVVKAAVQAVVPRSSYTDLGVGPGADSTNEQAAAQQVHADVCY